jgi:kynurenine formamidase
MNAIVLLMFVSAPASEEYLDLTYPFDESTIYWPTAKPFELDVVHKGPTPGGYHYEANNYSAAEHGGTHLDAPVHFAKGRWATDEVPLTSLIGPAVVVDIADKTPDGELQPSDLEAWEKKFGRIPDGSILLVRTGWGRFWPDKKKYLGTDKPGDVANLHFPGIAPRAAEWLLANRKLKAIGIDTPSVDRGQSKDFKTHVLFYEQNIPGLENVANLEKLPPTGATIYALPMKIRGGSGAPCRIIATVRPK